MVMDKALVIVNPNAGAGTALHMWNDIQDDFITTLGEPMLAVTHSIHDVGLHLHTALDAGIRHIISVGGDGSNHQIINTLLPLIDNNPEVMFSTIPAGTGRDWVRGAGLPMNPRQMLQHIRDATPRKIDIGQVTVDNKIRYFLNISSAGISNDVVQRVENTPHKRAWTYLLAVLGGILGYKPELIKIYLDGELWYEDKMFLVAIANGTTFGQGLIIAPEAVMDDGLLDVVIIEAMARPQLIMKLQMVFKGTHLTDRRVHFKRARHIRIVPTNSQIGMDFDGEGGKGTDIEYQIIPSALTIKM